MKVCIFDTSPEMGVQLTNIRSLWPWPLIFMIEILIQCIFRILYALESWKFASWFVFGNMCAANQKNLLWPWSWPLDTFLVLVCFYGKILPNKQWTFYVSDKVLFQHCSKNAITVTWRTLVAMTTKRYSLIFSKTMKILAGICRHVQEMFLTVFFTIKSIFSLNEMLWLPQ